MRFFGGACRVPRGELEKRIARLLELVDLEGEREDGGGKSIGRHAAIAGDRVRVGARAAVAFFG